MTDHPNLASALAAFQAELPHVGKGKKADTGKYSYTFAGLDDIAFAAHPLLAKHGLAFLCKPTTVADGGFVLAYKLMHGSSGEVEAGEYPLPDPAKNPPQTVGSAVTYGRRYCLQSVTGIVAEEDDDAQAAQGSKAKPRVKRAERGPLPADADPWAAASPDDAPPPPPDTRVTDQAWFEGWLARVMETGDVAQLQPLREEAKAKYREGKVTKADAEEVAEALQNQTDALERAAADGGWPAVKTPGSGEAA